MDQDQQIVLLDYDMNRSEIGINAWIPMLSYIVK